MRRAVVVTMDGFKRVTVLDDVGDWAITIRPGEAARLTHLPTGAACCYPGTDVPQATLAKAMRELDTQVVQFDVQTFDDVSDTIERVLRKHGLRPAWRRK